MTMLDDRPAAVPTLEEAIAQLDSPEAVADRRRRATKRAKALEGLARGRVIFSAGIVELDKALGPLRRNNWHPTSAEVREAEIQAGHGVDQLVAKQCEIHIYAEDLRDVYADPRRQAAERAWNDYTRTISQLAMRHGTREGDFIRRWTELIAARNDALELGDLGSVAAIEGRLKKLTGVDYPVVPIDDEPTTGTPKRRRRA
jgi:DNA-binding helix-hairpin-helix protein with protein kinase domain